MINLMEHNKETYKDLCKTLSQNNKCALVQATGTGKSYIASKYIEQHGDSALIIVPSNAIADAWSELLCNIEKEIDIITYQLFCKNPTKYIDYDIIIADEMHHLGSEVWGKNFIDTYLKNENHKIIGLTATEIRYLDNSRNMVEELFDGVRVDGCDLPTAINKGILPTFKYVSALYCKESDFEEWRAKTENIKNKDVRDKLKGELDFCIKNMVSVKQAIQENITDEYKKIIIFLNNVESKENAMDMFKNIFPEANFYSCDYTNYSNSKKQLSAFKNDSSFCVLFAIDMLNEGIHIDGVDCVIMFRKTESPQIYLQQLGRALSSSADKMPVIFDFVSNINNISTRNYNNKEIKFIKQLNKITKKDKQIILKSYINELSNILMNISAILKNSWTKKEDDFIITNFELMSIKEIAKNLNRPFSTTGARCRELGLHKHKYGQKKCNYDIKVLDNFNHFHDWTIASISKDTGIPHYVISEYMSKNGIKPYRNRIKKNKITECEMNYILENCHKKTLEELATYTGCSVTCIYNFLKKKGIHKTKKITSLDQENEIIELLKLGKSYAFIAKKYRYSPAVIRRIAKENNVKSLYIDSNKPKRIIQLDSEFNFVSVYENSKQAAKCLGINTEKNLRACANGKTKTSNGYIWMYEEDYEKMLKEKILQSSK